MQYQVYPGQKEYTFKYMFHINYYSLRIVAFNWQYTVLYFTFIDRIQQLPLDFYC